MATRGNSLFTYVFPREINNGGLKSAFSCVDERLGSLTQIGKRSPRFERHTRGFISKEYSENFAYADLSFQKKEDHDGYWAVAFNADTTSPERKDLTKRLVEEVRDNLAYYFSTH